MGSSRFFSELASLRPHSLENPEVRILWLLPPKRNPPASFREFRVGAAGWHPGNPQRKAQSLGSHPPPLPGLRPRSHGGQCTSKHPPCTAAPISYKGDDCSNCGTGHRGWFQSAGGGRGQLRQPNGLVAWTALTDAVVTASVNGGGEHLRHPTTGGACEVPPPGPASASEWNGK